MEPGTTEIYTLPHHDALPIPGGSTAYSHRRPRREASGPKARSHGSATSRARRPVPAGGSEGSSRDRDRKSTRLNSSHANISYAVFCLKKKITFFPAALPYALF